MKIEKKIKYLIQDAFKSKFKILISLKFIKLYLTSKKFIGSYTFVIFSFVKKLKLNPIAIGNTIGKFLKDNSFFINNFIIVKGFLNIIIKNKYLIKQLKYTIDGNFFINKKKKILVEFSSPNTNKPLHIGHLRNIFLGDSISKILKFIGHKIYKVNLVNDRGIHISKSMIAYQKFGNNTNPGALGIKGDHFVGQYYIKFEKEYRKELFKNNFKKSLLLFEARGMLKKWELKNKYILDLKNKMNNWVYQGFNNTYRKININFDRIYYESQTYLLGKEIVINGLEKNIFYKKKDNSVCVDLKKEGFGEKVLLRSNETSLYITQDLGTIEMRHKDYNFNKLIYIVGNEQKHNFDVLFKILNKLNKNYAVYHLSYGMVNLPNGKIQSRKNNFVDADFLIKKIVFSVKLYINLSKKNNFFLKEKDKIYNIIGIGALKYFFLKVLPKNDLLFNPKLSISLNGNTAPFIQYTYVRIFSMLKNINKKFFLWNNFFISDLDDLHFLEKKIIIKICNFYKKLKEASQNYSPYVIVKYLFELTKLYNTMYGQLSILHIKNNKKKKFRIYLSYIIIKMIKVNMRLLGIELPNKM